MIYNIFYINLFNNFVFYYFFSDTFAKYHCNYCEDDVNGLRVRCLECEDFDLCLQV